MEDFAKTWLPQVQKVTEGAQWQAILEVMQKDKKQNPVKQTFADIRIKYIDDVVPLDWKKRKDFIMNNEFGEACQILGERYGHDLKPLSEFFKLRIKKCKEN